MAPSSVPSATPALISRPKTRNQSRNRSSFKARARMIRDAAWEPELPPLLMMSGTKSANTTARSISRS